MIVVIERNAPKEEIKKVEDKLKEWDYTFRRIDGTDNTVFGTIGQINYQHNYRALNNMPYVKEVIRISEPYKFAHRSFHPENTIIKIKDFIIGGEDLCVIAGPCAVEGRDEIHEIAGIVKSNGIHILRGGAYKPRTSPYSFQGLGEEGLKYMREAADKHNMLVVSEVLDMSLIGTMQKYCDIIQVGARNMHNFLLLKELGKTRTPILLKRGFAATYQDWLLAAEYILSEGNFNVILCERGIRTFENYTRNTLDIAAIPTIKKLSHLPILSDPSHGTGIRDKVSPMAKAAVAAGADGVMIEVHQNPEKAFSDGPQSLPPEEFTVLMLELKQIAGIVKRKINGEN